MLVDDRIDREPSHRGAPDRLDRLVDAAFFVLVGATIVCLLVKAKDLGFFADDWRLAQRGGSIGDYFQPYNDSLVVVPIAIYRALYAVFGFHTEVPLRLVGVVSGAAIAVAMFFVVRASRRERRRVGRGHRALVVSELLSGSLDVRSLPRAHRDHRVCVVADERRRCCRHLGRVGVDLRAVQRGIGCRRWGRRLDVRRARRALPLCAMAVRGRADGCLGDMVAARTANDEWPWRALTLRGDRVRVRRRRRVLSGPRVRQSARSPSCSRSPSS